MIGRDFPLTCKSFVTLYVHNSPTINTNPTSSHNDEPASSPRLDNTRLRLGNNRDNIIEQSVGRWRELFVNLLNGNGMKYR